MQEKTTDKNSVIGFILIGAILIGYFFYQAKYAPIPEETTTNTVTNEAEQATIISEDGSVEGEESTPVILLDSSEQSLALKEQFVGFAESQLNTNEKIIEVETELLKLTFSSKGAMLKSAIVKNFVTFDSIPIDLLDKEKNDYHYTFKSDGKDISTSNLNYQYNGQEKIEIKGDGTVEVKFTANHINGQVLEHIYVIPGNSYLIDYQSKFNNLAQSPIAFSWENQLRQNEKSKSNELQYSGVYYREKAENDVDDISGKADDVENEFESDLNWIGFKNQYFTSFLVNESGFNKSGLTLTSKSFDDTTLALKDVSIEGSLSDENVMMQAYSMQLFFGPTDYDLLAKYDLNFEDVVPYGWGLFEFFNVYFTLPLVKLLVGWNINYGLIIFLVALCVKLLVSPFTYKTYLSTMKMKVLKPELDEIKERCGKDQTKLQQEQFKLYGKAGVNPLGGCIPMLFQMPILFAMFRYFPASLELRQKGFLWADDLSTYDSIFDIGFEIPFYGDHVSLFCLLMTITTILSTKANSSQMPDSGNGMAAQQMKIMQYMMPVMFLGMFNTYACALSIYYTCMNCLTLLQQYIIKNVILDEAKIHAQIKERQKGPDKKSKFRQKFDALMEQSQQAKKR